MKKRYYQHSIWGESNEWIESDKDTFNDEVIEQRNQYTKRYEFKEKKTIYYFDNKTNSAYDWKIEVTIK